MSPALILIGLLVLVALVALVLKWRRSRQHIGIARPDGPVNAPDPTVTPSSISYKQVIAPGADPSRIDQPSGEVEDVLAVRPGAPEPGQTFTPAPSPSPDQTPNSPVSPNPAQDPTQTPPTPPVPPQTPAP